jgi:hypothetical protein
MVALKPGEPLVLYITITIEVVSMVLVAEQPKPQQPQVPKGALVAGSRSQDPDPIGGLKIRRLLSPSSWSPP